MKIKVDENLPLRVSTLLSGLGHDAHTVHDERLTGRPDDEIWQAAQAESRFLLTQDMDFSDLRSYAPGSHHGILLIRLQSPRRRDLAERILQLFREEQVSKWVGCFVVATERKIRILKPPNMTSS